MTKSHVDNLLKKKRLLGRKSTWKMLFCMRIFFSEKGNTCTLVLNFNFCYYWKEVFVVNADSKVLCLEQTFFEIVLEAFCKVTKNVTCSAWDKVQIMFRRDWMVFLIRTIVTTLLLSSWHHFWCNASIRCNTSYTKALALYYLLYLRTLLEKMTLALLPQWILELG